MINEYFASQLPLENQSQPQPTSTTKMISTVSPGVNTVNVLKQLVKITDPNSSARRGVVNSLVTQQLMEIYH